MKIRRANVSCALLESARVGGRVAAVIAGALAFAPFSASAAATVSGTADAVIIKTQNSSVEDVLAALSHQFKLKYRSSADLKTEISGTYEGSLRCVVARILSGYNFVVRSSPSGIEVIFLASHGAPAGAVTVSAKADLRPQGWSQQSAAPAPSDAAAQAANQAQAAPHATAGKTPAPTPDLKLAEGSLPAPPMPQPAALGSSLPAPPVPKAPPSGSSFPAPPIPKAFEGSSFAAPPVPIAGATAMPAPPVPPQLAGSGASSSNQPAPSTLAKALANAPTPAAPASKSN